MKINEVKVDTDRIETGAWVENIPDMEGLRLRVRGANNKDWRRLQTRLIQATPRKRRMSGTIDPDDSDRIMIECLLQTSLLDWDGLEDEDNKPIPYDRELAKKFLTDPNYRRFREAVSWAANWLAESGQEDLEEDSANLSKLSLTSIDGDRKLKAG